ncbi:unnamed protein product [Allacma fusca]|uniref:Uncharacterized protein n=1 Tax=Allacma fusca TaxID=39272 RepID=A0A8J2JTM4_9HEXA|nr:unnamed protein product [Allacma fusca]
MLPNICKSVKPAVERLLNDDIRMLVYAPQLDIIVPHTGVDKYVKSLSWETLEIWRRTINLSGLLKRSIHLPTEILSKGAAAIRIYYSTINGTVEKSSRPHRRVKLRVESLTELRELDSKISASPDTYTELTESQRSVIERKKLAQTNRCLQTTNSSSYGRNVRPNTVPNVIVMVGAKRKAKNHCSKSKGLWKIVLEKVC